MRCLYVAIFLLGAVAIAIAVWIVIHCGFRVHSDWLASASCHLVPLYLGTPPQRVIPTAVDAFRPAVTDEQRYWLWTLLNVFAYRMRKWNITNWFIGYGTLLGCYRFGHFTPWDDDVDVSVGIEHRSQVVQALNDATEDGHFAGHWDLEELNYKFFTRRFAYWDKHYPWPWPAVDIFFHRANHSWLQDTSPHWNHFLVPAHLVLPLTQCTLGVRSFPAPAHIRAVLQFLYGNLSVCQTHFYNHQTGTSKPVVVLPCAELTHLYLFKQLH